jgi:hypothetical protein
VASVEFVGVGDPLADMPLFSRPEVYVPAPLEATYQTTWSDFRAVLKGCWKGRRCSRRTTPSSYTG